MSQLNEPILDDNYPVYSGFLYVVDGEVRASLVKGNVGTLKEVLSRKGKVVQEVRCCDLLGRGYFKGGGGKMIRLTEQDVFNTAYRGMRSQGFEQSKRDGIVAYRGESGKRCPIGWLIHDNVYRTTMEGRTVVSLVENYSHLHYLKGFTVLLRYLQAAHDSSSGPRQLQLKLQEIARQRGLRV